MSSAQHGLDVIRLNFGLRQEFGSDVVWQHPDIATSAVRCLTPDGLSMAVGFFNDGAPRQGFPYGSKNHFALISYPKHPSNLYHDIAIVQTGEDMTAEFTEKDSSDWLEGLGSGPEIIKEERLKQPRLAELVHHYALGCYVLSVSQGDAHRKAIRSANIPQARAIGLAVIEDGNYMGRINDALLQSCGGK